MRRKRARRRDQDAQEASEPVEQEDSVVEHEGGGDEEEPSVLPAISETPQPLAAGDHSADSESQEASIDSGAESEKASEPETEHAPEPLTPAAQKDAPVGDDEPPAEQQIAAAPESQTESEVRPAELEALGRELERSLGGPEQSPPKHGGGIPIIEAPPPPAINATPEDILGVPTQTLGGEKAPEDDQKPAASAAAMELAKQGGPPPMEEFEERAQMASEVLRATGHGDRRHRIDQGASGASSEDDQPTETEDPSDDVDRNVRFSEDVTISSKRKRKLFGR
jgi:hypothetical protein